MTGGVPAVNGAPVLEATTEGEDREDDAEPLPEATMPQPTPQPSPSASPHSDEAPPHTSRDPEPSSMSDLGKAEEQRAELSERHQKFLRDLQLLHEKLSNAVPPSAPADAEDMEGNVSVSSMSSYDASLLVQCSADSQDSGGEFLQRAKKVMMSAEQLKSALQKMKRRSDP